MGIAQISLAQNTRQITGKIQDAVSGESVPGASVLIKGTTSDTTANSDGNFSLKIPDTKSVILVVSSLGFITQNIGIGDRSVINVALTNASTELGVKRCLNHGNLWSERANDVLIFRK